MRTIPLTMLLVLLALPTFAAETKKTADERAYFSCEAEVDGVYVDRESCHDVIACKGGQKQVRPCPEGQVINTRKPPPWQCEPLAKAGMTADCQPVAK